MQNSNPSLLRPLITLVAILATFAVNVWSNLAPITGLTIGEISNQFFSDVLIIPANYAFIIWGVIYLGLITFAIYQVLPAQRDHSMLQRIGSLVIISSLVQIGWVFLFLYQQFSLSVIAMLGILLPLIGIHQAAYTQPNRASRQQRWFVRLPFSIYLGWISVATIVNVAIALDAVNWNGWGLSPAIWTIIMLCVGAVLGAILLLRWSDVAYPLVLMWAFVGVAVRQSDRLPIALVASSLTVVLLVLVLAQLRGTGQPNT